jgi:hypothetical protein
MNVLMMRSKWDLDALPFEEFLRYTKSAGFDGTEIHLPSLHAEPEASIALHEEYGLKFIAMVITEGKTADEHIAMLEQRFRSALRYKPLLVNCHTGRDIFSLEENLRIFQRGVALSEETGVPLCHETHRGRALFSVTSTRAILSALPAVRLNADFSHWCCVHESLLHDQEESVQLAIRHTAYIHARVGHMQGPQVSDPRAPEWSAEVERHFGWWEQIAAERARQGAPWLAVCPEFGPAPYMPSLPFTRQPVADLREVIVHQMEQLRRRLAARLALPSHNTSQ